jgi:peptide/nickel transport system permease protein
MSTAATRMGDLVRPTAIISPLARRGMVKTIVGAILCGLVILLVAVSPWLSPYDPIKQVLTDRLHPPIFAGGAPDHLLGTDELGRDVLSRLMAGGRISLLIAALAVIGSTCVGSVLGLVGAFYGGKLDSFLTMLAEIQLSLPSILIIIVFIALVGPSVVTLGLILALSDWVVYARTMRGRALVEQAREYIMAARASGVKNRRIILRHLWPNVSSTLLVLATLSVGGVILTESALSFLGLGVQRPFPSWGRMVSDGQAYLTNGWWISTMPALVIASTVFGLNLLGDGLRQLWKME